MLFPLATTTIRLNKVSLTRERGGGRGRVREKERERERKRGGNIILYWTKSYCQPTRSKTGKMSGYKGKGKVKGKRTASSEEGPTKKLS